MSYPPSEQPYSATACFAVHARAEPGVMPRVMGLFAKLGLVPSQVHCATIGYRGEELSIDVQVPGVGQAERDNIARGLGRIVEVTTVLTTEKRIAA